MGSVIIYEKFGLKITLEGKLTTDDLEILREEVRATILDILKFRKFGGDRYQRRI